MHQPVYSALYYEEGIKVNITGHFYGFEAFERVCNLMLAVGCIRRVNLNFSNADRVKPIEIYYLLAELAADLHFKDIELSVEGLRCSCMDKNSADSD